MQSIFKKSFLSIYNILLICIFSFLTLYRSVLATSGHLYWADEIRNYSSIVFHQNLIHGNFKAALLQLFTADARPGAVLFGAIPAHIQFILFPDKLTSYGNVRNFVTPNAFNPHIYDIPAYLNVLCTLISAILVYKLLQYCIRDKWITMAGVVVYGLLCNTNLYVRHILPYEMSLMLLLTGFYIVLLMHQRGRLGILTVMTCGLLSGIAFSAYPGYCYFVIINGILVYAVARKYIRMSIIYGLAFLSVIALYEVLARGCGVSYIQNTRELSSTIVHGSFSEGLIYIFRYLATVEGAIGYGLLFLCFIFIFWLLPKKKILLKPIFITLILCYLFHGIRAVIFQKVVFYGRILHMFIPFMVISGMMTLDAIKPEKIRHLFCYAILCLSVFSFAIYGPAYVKLLYPKDFIYKYLPHIAPGNVYMDNELEDDKKTFVPETHYVALINVIDFEPIPDSVYHAEIPGDMVLLKSKPHPLNFIANQFEGYSIEGRKKMKQRKYAMKMYVTKSRLDEFNVDGG